MHAIVKHSTDAFLAIAPRRTILAGWFQLYLYHVYYRYWCPGGSKRVRDCVSAGECGCDNRDRF